MTGEQVATAPRGAEAHPSIELIIAALVAAGPQVIALVAGGYGHILGLVPLAIGATLADIAAVVVAVLELRATRERGGGAHWLIWLTFALAGLWLAYVFYVGAVALFARFFCINQACRMPIR